MRQKKSSSKFNGFEGASFRSPHPPGKQIVKQRQTPPDKKQVYSEKK